MQLLNKKVAIGINVFSLIILTILCIWLIISIRGHTHRMNEQSNLVLILLLIFGNAYNLLDRIWGGKGAQTKIGDGVVVEAFSPHGVSSFQTPTAK